MKINFPVYDASINKNAKLAVTSNLDVNYLKDNINHYYSGLNIETCSIS